MFFLKPKCRWGAGGLISLFMPFIIVAVVFYFMLWQATAEAAEAA